MVTLPSECRQREVTEVSFHACMDAPEEKPGHFWHHFNIYTFQLSYYVKDKPI
jgi:hypothetical protein